MLRLPHRMRPLFPLVKAAYTTGTRVMAPMTVQLSRLGGGYLPLGAALTMERAAALGGGRCARAREPELVRRRPPTSGVPPRHKEFEQNLTEQVPRVAVVELPGGRVLGPHGAVITGAGQLLHETSRYFGTTRPHEHPLFLHPFPGSPLDVPGRVATLASRGDANYYHFMMDAVSRLGVLEQCPEVAPPDRWYVAAETRFQRELLDMCGITEDRRIDRMCHPHLRAECLVVPGPPSMPVVNPPWVVAFLRNLLLPPDLGRVVGRWIYASRGESSNNRGVVNETAVRQQLVERGFTVVDAGAMSVPEQITTFAQASVIVAPHGAAITNIVFTSPGAHLVELFPAGGVVADYWKMACGVPGLAYHYLEGRGDQPTLSRTRMLVSDIDVDLDALVSLLDGIDAGTRRGRQDDVRVRR